MPAIDGPATGTTTPAGDGSSLERRVDHVDTRWNRRIATGTGRALLPAHPWIGHLRPINVAEPTPGSGWVSAIDLVAEEDPDGRDLIWLRGARMTMRLDGRALERNDLGSLRGHRAGLVLIAAGTLLRLVAVSGWSDRHYDAIGAILRFALPDGRSFSVTTEESDPEDRGMTLSDLLIAAVVVPVDHPVARDETIRDETITRIEVLADSGVGRG